MTKERWILSEAVNSPENARDFMNMNGIKEALAIIVVWDENVDVPEDKENQNKK